jgi:hypothetical protein
MSKKLNLVPLAIAVILGFSACANIQKSRYETKISDLQSWISDQQSKVASGALLRSQFWSEYYDRAAAPPDGPMDVVLMKQSWRMVGVSKSFESGKIGYDDYRAAATDAIMQIREQHEKLVTADNDDRQRRAAIAAMIIGGSAAAPAPTATYHPILPSPVLNTNCQRFGNITNCQTY